MFNSKDKQIIINIQSATVVRVLAIVVATLVGLAFFKSLAHPLILIFVSFFLALALNPAVSKISHMLRIKSRAAATGIAYIFVLVFLTAFIAFVVPPLVRQTVDFVKDVPGTVQDLKSNDSSLSKFIDRYKLQPQVDQFTEDFSERFKNIGAPVLDTAGVIGSTIVNTITVLVLTFMMLVEGPIWLAHIWSIQNSKRREHRKIIAQKMYKAVTNYVNGQVFIAALGGFFATVALFILSQVFDASVNAIALGGIIGLFALLPLIGTTIGAVIVVLACLLVSAPLAIAAAIYFVIYQQIENVTIQPYIQARGNNLTPLIVFVSALLGVGIGGILGAFVAIPAASCIKILVEDHFERRPITKEV